MMHVHYILINVSCITEQWLALLCQTPWRCACINIWWGWQCGRPPHWNGSPPRATGGGCEARPFDLPSSVFGSAHTLVIDVHPFHQWLWKVLFVNTVVIQEGRRVVVFDIFLYQLPASLVLDFVRFRWNLSTDHLVDFIGGLWLRVICASGRPLVWNSTMWSK